MAWPFKQKAEEPQMANEPTNPEKTPDTTPTKSIAETLSESLSPLKEEFAAMRRDIEELRTPKPPVRTVSQERVSVLDDEDAAFNQRMTPILQSQLELEARYNRDQVKAEYVEAGFGDFWRENEKRINDKLSASPLVQPDGNGGVLKLRGDEQYIRNVVNMFMGEAARAGGVKFDGAKKTFFLEGANGGESAAGSRAAETEGLTAKQVKLAQRLGIPMDAMKKTVSKLEFVS
jgi:hypothetical protein